MKKKNKGKVILIIFLAVVLLCLASIKTNGEVEITKPVIEEEIQEITIKKISEYRSENNNNDIIARLVIDDLEIDTLITKSNNNKYYLNHDIHKNESNLGNPFIDFRNSNNLSNERQINIYSHNSDYSVYQEQLPFYKLEKLFDKDNFDKVKKIELYTEEEKSEYEIVALKVVTTDNEHTVLDSKSNERWEQHLEKLLSDTKYCRDDCKLNVEDKLLILQTCNYNPQGSYIVLIAKKIKGEIINER